MCICVCHTVQRTFAFVTECNMHLQMWIDYEQSDVQRREEKMGSGTVQCYLVYLWYILYVFVFVSQNIMRSLLFNWGWVVEVWNAILWQMMTATSFPSLWSLRQTGKYTRDSSYLSRQTSKHPDYGHTLRHWIFKHSFKLLDFDFDWRRGGYKEYGFSAHLWERHTKHVCTGCLL